MAGLFSKRVVMRGIFVARAKQISQLRPERHPSAGVRPERALQRPHTANAGDSDILRENNVAVAGTATLLAPVWTAATRRRFPRRDMSRRAKARTRLRTPKNYRRSEGNLPLYASESAEEGSKSSNS